MSRGTDRQKADLIKGLVAEARNIPNAKLRTAAAIFVRRYYEWVPPADMIEMGRENLFGAARAHFEFGAERAPGKPRIRLYNPTRDEHGWDSEHTVIEIVNDDMPFLVDSVAAALTRRDIAIRLIVHPILPVRREGGVLTGVVDGAKAPKGAMAESFMHVEVARQPASQFAEIAAAVRRVLDDVRAAVADWNTMRGRVLAAIDEIHAEPGPLSAGEAEEIAEFLQWIHDNNFTLLGYRGFDVSGHGRKTGLTIIKGSGLGIMRDPKFRVFDEFLDLNALRPEVRAFVSHPQVLTLNKTDRMSTVHRPVTMDSITVRRFDSRGRVVGQHLFVGLFTSSAYNRNPREIPLLRGKVQRVLKRADLPPASHDGRALMNILDTFPRDELFQASEDHLLNTSLGVLDLQERPRTALFLRRDDLDRFMSCLVYVPRDRYDTALRRRMQALLEEAFDGVAGDWYTTLGEAPLARFHLFVRTRPGKIPPYDADALEARMIEVTRSWVDALQDVLIAAHGEADGLDVFRRYQDAFRLSYRERFTADEALGDVLMIESVRASHGEIGMALRRLPGAPASEMRFKLYHPKAPVPLSDVLPMLEHMGLKVMDEIPFAVGSVGGDITMIHDFGLRTRDGSAIDLESVRANFQGAFLRIWRGEVESDGFNALVVRVGLTWREVVVLRAYCKYLRQAGIAFSQAYMEQTLIENAELAALIVRLFLSRFDPDGGTGAARRAARIREQLTAGLDAVVNADQDRILRRFLNIVDATLRTNYFQTAVDGGPKPYLSVKLDSRAIDELPLPRPLLEVWVYSPRTECIHLRGGKVARGGIRWSDRREDFRTEILGLMKAQMVKNAVIVPVGSKGGFVLKKAPPASDREAFLAEGIECYKTLMRGLLDVTDNFRGREVIPPPEVVRADPDDPYLVVAADKGTATFSDIANGVSADYGFWLDDAYASGGSHGYDHKKMGITARGAWESVKRHFREIGVDTQAQDFTVVGVGDMSGDVFGNGMLLSEHIRLLAAFNHLHIFVDPDPDPKKAFAERKRLFDLPRSSWSDYDPKALSKGGAIYERSAKTLKLTSEIKACFGIETDTVTPNELISTLLKAEIDLLWFGGIGTYVKATLESNADAGDRANDGVRISASQLRCRVIGEGANLAVTQRARVEFALRGGRLNTDAIDNSAGVDTSDHEVNIKILLGAVVAEGRMTLQQRNRLLVRMTDEVAQLVLRDNYLQTQALSRATSQGIEYLDDQARFLRFLEREGRLDRAVEFLPDDETLAERTANKCGLQRPESAVLMSYAKLWLYDQLLHSDLPDDNRLVNDLVRYFPAPLQKPYRKEIEHHRLRREIIATIVTNSIVNRIGGTFVMRLMEETGMPPAEIARAYTVVRKVFVLRDIWDAIEALDGKVAASAQIAMMHDINRMLERATLWFLRNGILPLDIDAHVAEFQEGVQTLSHRLEDALPGHYLDGLAEASAPRIEAGVPKALALKVAAQVNLLSALDIVRLAKARKRDVVEVSRLYFSVGGWFKLGRLRAAAERLEADSHWQKMAVSALIEEIYSHQAQLTAQVLDVARRAPDPDAAIRKWEARHESVAQRAEQMLNDLWSTEVNDLSMIAVASRQLRALVAAAGS